MSRIILKIFQLLFFSFEPESAWKPPRCCKYLSAQELDRALKSALNSHITRATTPAQLPGVCWRKRRAVGYQGVVSTSCIQRQSLKWGSRIQTGLPMAPARCAMQVSVVIIRSSVDASAAVSARSLSWRAPSQTRNIAWQIGQLICGRTFLQRNPGDAAQMQQRQQSSEVHGALCVRLVTGIACPDNAHSQWPSSFKLIQGKVCGIPPLRPNRTAGPSTPVAAATFAQDDRARSILDRAGCARHAGKLGVFSAASSGSAPR